MNKKLRQITDTLHGTIYLSELESQMMSTPFFNRLNDVYQSSTVYLTFPANRTKRYEHSLGTMELTGQMLFSSIQNSAVSVRTKFFEKIEKDFDKLIDKLCDRKKAFYYTDDAAGNLIDEYLPKDSCGKERVVQCVNHAMKAGSIGDIALEHSAICFNNIGIRNDKLDESVIVMYSYLYQCVLEASRIAALFHDVGHPPYSHIIEDSLSSLYSEVANDKTKPKKCKKYIETKAESFLSSLKPFVGKSAVPDLLIGQKAMRSKTANSFAIHENIGTKILTSAFKGVVGKILKDIGEDEFEIRFAKALYYITIIEFTFAILLESTPEMKAIHHIISGPIDSDRLDYIMRDSINSGVNWGTIPYKRIVASARLIYHDRTFQIAFPQKLTDDLDDLLICRYKIFTRINYHHRSVKTASLLKAAVHQLVLDYLMKDDSEGEKKEKNTKNMRAEIISPEISNLWTSLNGALGQNATERKMAQWNDSWLISVCAQALIRLSDSDVRQRLVYEEKGITNTHLEYILNLLEEVLLNKKNYYSMVKRQSDAHDLMDMVVENIDLQFNIDSIIQKEQNKLCAAKSEEEKEDAKDALQRLDNLLRIIDEANFDDLDTFFAMEGHCEEYVRKVLEASKEEGTISDYIIEKNVPRNKWGVKAYNLEPEDTIYLYTLEKTFKYDVTRLLFKQLRAISLGCSWLFVYIKVDQDKADKAGEIIEKQKIEISKEIGNDLKIIFSYLFNYEFVNQ